MLVGRQKELPHPRKILFCDELSIGYVEAEVEKRIVMRFDSNEQQYKLGNLELEIIDC